MNNEEYCFSEGRPMGLSNYCFRGFAVNYNIGSGRRKDYGAL